jgi:hypothetical protein
VRQQLSPGEHFRRGNAILIQIVAQYADWLEAPPEGLNDSPTAQALTVVVELDLNSLAEIEPPRGYGRD